MKKGATYFNFGFLLVVVALTTQLILMLVFKLFKYHGPEFLVLGLPPLLTIILGFVWYQKEKVLLQLEQYLIAIVPLLFFVALALVKASKNYLELDVAKIGIALFVSSFISLRILIHFLASKFKEELIANRLSAESAFYLIGCTLAIWSFFDWLFLN